MTHPENARLTNWLAQETPEPVLLGDGRGPARPTAPGFPTGSPDDEYYLAGLSTTMTNTDREILWYKSYNAFPGFQGQLVRNHTVTVPGTGPRIFGEGEVHEFTFNSTLNTFAFIVGQQSDGGQNDEGFFVDDFEIWVK